MMKQQSLSALAVLALLAGLAACGGGGGGGSSPIPAGGGGATPTPVASPVTTPGGPATTTSVVTVFPTSVPLAVGALTGSIALPNGSLSVSPTGASATPAPGITVSISIAAPPGLPTLQSVQVRTPQGLRPEAISPSAILCYVTLSVPLPTQQSYTAAIIATLDGIPGASFANLPVGSDLGSAIFTYNPQATWASIQTPIPIAAPTTTFPISGGNIAFGNYTNGFQGNMVTLAFFTVPPLTSGTTNASGMVVDDANGSPLAGVPVKLMPWGPCGAVPPAAQITPENDGCPTPLPSPQATTNPQGQFTLNGAPNGHYLLVIGTDSTSDVDPVQATVHDNVTLTGGNQTLLAPTLPPVPTITPQPWETNGEYRLATLNPTSETPCFVDWQQERTTNGLPVGSIDEWLLENVRASNTYRQDPNYANAPWPGNPFGLLTTGNEGSGGTSCQTGIASMFVPGTVGGNYSYSPQTTWFAGQYVPYNSVHSSQQSAEFPIDPRAFVDPNVPNWP